MICRQCRGRFLSTIKISHKRRYLHKRRFCLKCSPFGRHNTSKFPHNFAYTKKSLAPIVRRNRSYMGVLRDLGRKIGGGTQTHIKYKIKQLGISTKHFWGMGSNRGKAHKGGPLKRPYWIILVKNGKLEKPSYLRGALVESGRKYRCKGRGCGIINRWLGKKITLQIHHLNGIRDDNRAKNLIFLCPNCHAQTQNWSNLHPSKTRK